MSAKLMAITGLFRNMYGQYRFQQLLSGIIMVLGLTLFTAILICLLVVGGLFAVYYTLLDYGWAEHAAAYLTGGAFAFITLVFIILTAVYLRRLKNMLFQKSPLATMVGEAVESFFDGLMTQEPL